LSSILKALQRLESETREQDAGQSWLQNFNAGRKYREKQERTPSKSLMALLFIGILISGAAALLFIKKQSPSLTPAPGSPLVQDAGNPVSNNEASRADHFTDKTIGAQEAGKPEGKSDKLPGIEIIPESHESVKVTVPTGVNESRALQSGPAGMPVVAGNTKKSSVVSPERPLKQETRRVAEVPSVGNKATMPLSEPLETSEIPPRPDGLESPDIVLNQEERLLKNEIEATDKATDAIVAGRLHDPEMKLHAISWTPDAENRIAVINGSIVREGTTIGDYRVYKINKDDIVLRKNGEMWRLVFGEQ
jgi:hypothetical protein